MKFLIARLNHETNTFSPVATPLQAFAPDYGAAAVVFSLALLGLNVGAVPKELVVSQAMSFPVNADFVQGSFVLGINAQERLDGVVRSLYGADLEVLVVKAFAGPNDTPLLALERARSVRAFFVLHGVAPERVYIDSGSDDLRPHRFELDVVASRKW